MGTWCHPHVLITKGAEGPAPGGGGRAEARTPMPAQPTRQIADKAANIREAVSSKKGMFTGGGGGGLRNRNQ